jgi:prepilin-type N-terminal cleavage/methylation domain-containing protein
MKPQIVKNNSGFSLLEVLVASGIASILALVIASMISQMRGSLASIEKKQNLLQFQNSLSTLFQNSAICSWQLKETSSGIIRRINVSGTADPTTRVISGANINFDKIYEGSDSSSSVLARVDDNLLSSQNKVKSIQLKNVTSIDATSGFYSGEIEVEIEFNVGETILKNPKTKVFFSTSLDNPSSRTILNCSANNQSEVIFTYPKVMEPFVDGGVPNQSSDPYWTYTTMSNPRELNVPSSAKEFLIQIRCKQALYVKIRGLSHGGITLCRSMQNDYSSSIMWLKRNIESLDLYNNGIPLEGKHEGGNSSLEFLLLGYR